MRASRRQWDVILVGGGLHNCLLSLGLLWRHPDMRLALIEREARVGGRHTWCFHAADVPRSVLPWFGPLVEHRWAGYEVRFCGLQRELSQAYAGFGSGRLRRHVEKCLGRSRQAELMLETEACEVGPTRVRLSDGRELEAAVVIDGRGEERVGDRPSGWQKFVGWEVRLARACGLKRPLVMDATVPQRDGFRFMYVLPMSPTRLLVEDTHFSNSPALDVGELESGIRIYMRERGWSLADLERTEQGCLPMPYLSLPEPYEGELLRSGLRGGWFHPATGYSLPAALRVAQALGRAWPGDLRPAVERLRREMAASLSFGRLLNGMFFSIPGSFRWRVMRRFYRLDEERITRFYGLQSTAEDRARILFDRPPGLSWFRLPGVAFSFRRSP